VRLHNLLRVLDDDESVSFSLGAPLGPLPSAAWVDEVGAHRVCAPTRPESCDDTAEMLYGLIVDEVRATWNP
jgi:hypothetical protein